jgi:hypothetical protein
MVLIVFSLEAVTIDRGNIRMYDMFKLIAVVIFAAGVAVGVTFSDEIRSLWEETPAEQLQGAAEDAMDFVQDKLGE